MRKTNKSLLLITLIILIIPLAKATAPTYSDDSISGTSAGTLITHSLNWTDETGLSGYIFSFDNGTGILINDSWTAFSSNPDWSNVTKTINSTAGATIRWCVHANDTSDNWNSTSCITPFSYTTTFLTYMLANSTITETRKVNYKKTAGVINKILGVILALIGLYFIIAAVTII